MPVPAQDSSERRYPAARMLSALPKPGPGIQLGQGGPCRVCHKLSGGAVVGPAQHLVVQHHAHAVTGELHVQLKGRHRFQGEVEGGQGVLWSQAGVTTMSNHREGCYHIVFRVLGPLRPDQKISWAGFVLRKQVSERFRSVYGGRGTIIIPARGQRSASNGCAKCLIHRRVVLQVHTRDGLTRANQCPVVQLSPLLMLS